MKRLCYSALVLLVIFASRTNADQVVIEAPPRVMVLPFSPIGDVGAYQWAGTAVQQSMLSEVNRPGATVFSIPAPTIEPTTNPVDPMVIASQSSATMVAYGTFQAANDQLRFNGQLVDVNTKKVVATLAATGPAHDLFKIEDALTGQLHDALPQPVQYSSTTTTATAPPAPVSSPVVDYGTMNIEPSGYSTYGSYGYAYPATYGIPYPVYTSYGFGAPCVNFSSGFVFFGDFGDRRFHDRGFHDRGFHGFTNPRFGVGPAIGGFQPHVGFTGAVGGLRANSFGLGFRSGGFGGGFHSGGFGGGFHGGGFGGGMHR
jgi:TolB-like protein